MKLPFRKLPDRPQRSGFVDEQIDEAIKRGEFDNLEGKGKPLNLSGDLSDRRVMRAKIARDANFSPPWEDVGREIESAIQRAETAARRAWEFRLAGLHSSKADKTKIEADFERAKRDIEAQVAAINSLVLKYNLLFPPTLPHLHRYQVKSEVIWQKIAPESEITIKRQP